MADTPLAGLRIVVTRPQEQAAGLTQRITALGGMPLLFPLLEINPAPDPSALRAFVSQVERYQLLIFISPNAVQYGMQALQRLPAEVDVAAVGQGSARALRALGVAHVIAPEGRADSEALLALPELQNVSGRRIAILRGDGGRELLGDTLAARGAKITHVTCYRRSKAALDVAALRAARPDAITLTSSEALAHLDTALAGDAACREKIPLFVPHPRIAAAARALGWQTVLPTDSGDDGLCAGLVAWAMRRTQ
ncbi:uroporphyrinogen-III synthase [Ferrigenium sp. UT5]|uniref:uroporphyrinogen-III synthase n=1 Tax=Ferrigenium sp. UT5 TaxID=3242105 RepID=UPI00354BB85D